MSLNCGIAASGVPRDGRARGRLLEQTARVPTGWIETLLLRARGPPALGPGYSGCDFGGALRVFLSFGVFGCRSCHWA